MVAFIAFVHVIIALALIVFVLLQDPKEGAVGIFGGGGAHSMFGSSGAGGVLETATKVFGVLFAITCIGLAYITTHKGSSVLDTVSTPAAATAAPSPKVIDTTKATATDTTKAAAAKAVTPKTKTSKGPSAIEAPKAGSAKTAK